MLENEIKLRKIPFLFQFDGVTILILLLLDPLIQFQTPQRRKTDYWDVIPGPLYFPAPFYNILK